MYNGDGVLVQRGATQYAQDLVAPLSQVLTDGTTNYIYGHERRTALGQTWYVGDALGSVRQTLDSAGAVRSQDLLVVLRARRHRMYGDDR